MDKVIKTSFSTTISGELQENGGWKVTALLEDNEWLQDGTQFTEKIDAMSFDDDYVSAQQTALASALIQYRQEVLDNGFTGLVQARQSRKALENDGSKANTDTITQ